MSTTNGGEDMLGRLRSLDPYEFERFIADLWQETQGWSTRVTKQSRDWGADVLGRPPDGSDQKTVVQAKCYGPSNSVSSDQIQQYSALRQHDEKVTGVTVVTTSTFTSPAKRAADHLDVRCINGEQLAEMVQRDDTAEEILEWYLAGRPEDWHGR